MDDQEQLSVHCELADYIAGCTLDMTIRLQYDMKTDKYTLCGSTNPTLLGFYKGQEEFFAKMHAVLRRCHTTRAHLPDDYYGHMFDARLQISPFVLETIYRAQGFTPHRVVFAQLHHMAMEQWIKRGRLVQGYMDVAPGVRIPIHVVMVDKTAMYTFAHQFRDVVGRSPDSLAYRNSDEIKSGFVSETIDQ